ncbi:hypothetical protein AMAG_19663 [Allomyces macrogynus ATCC 38327]|uniref:Uncharacterized protein n=1 Tax=Allomyces macrogynus (strain ATCC 38327) TaxID=578462 RepID=A0A0L0SXP9_ALLM3|nr:hypothetical protein AMAG_19663 [Allomyces macrogynus ATCC 38327]|eukprot:KNE67175.1 hypothetical protein AMAG_19663 [Allomyces macrogynus ATCC 38327]
MAEGDKPAADAPAAVPQLPSISLPPMTPPPANPPPAASSSAPPAPAPEPTSAAPPPPASSSQPPAPAPTSNPPPPASSNPPPAPSSSAPAPASTPAAPTSSPSAEKPAQAATTAAHTAPAATSTFTPTPTPSTTWISSTVLITTESATVITGTDGTTSTSSVRVTVPVVTVLPSTVYVVPRVNGSEAETAASGSFGGAALVAAIAIPVLLVAAIAGFLVVRRRRASRHGSASLFRKRSGRQDTGTGPSISVFQPSNPQASLVRPSLSAPLIGSGNSGYEPVPHASGSFKGSSTGSAVIPPTPAQVRAAQDQEARMHHEHIEQQHRLLYAAGDKDMPSAAHLTPPPPPMWAGHANASDPDLSHLSLAPPPPLAAPGGGMYAHAAGSQSSGVFAPTVDPMSALLMDPLAEPMFADGPYDAHDDYALPPATTPLHTSVLLPPTGPVVPMPPTSATGLATRAEVTNLVVRPPQPPLPPMLPEYLPAPLQAPVHVPVEDQVVFAADPEAAMELLAGDEEGGRPESFASRSSLYLPTADRTMSGVWDEEREM